ncbi:PDZ domain-containing protein [Candidatus Bathyarchaeota archaeon]|nr:PDZ domain-containing protein [Candidatus Bathyarchaeota archaeon]
MLTGQDSEANDKVQRRIEFNFPILTIRTKLFTGIFDKLGSLHLSRWTSWMSLVIVPIVAGIGLYLIFYSLVAFLWNPAAGEIARELGPGAYILLPGINPFFPLLYGWLAIICAMVIHEGAHGIIARNLGLKVNSSGLLFVLFVPIGAFVDVDEEQIKKAKARVSSRVMAAGVGGNIAVAAVCLIGVLVIVSGLIPIIDGAYVYDVVQGLPAEQAGLLPRDVLVSIDNVRINNTSNLREILDNKTAGDIISVTVARDKMWRNKFSTFVNLTVSENRTVMGLSVGDLMTEDRLRNYQTVTLDRLPMYLVAPALAPDLVPFSDSLAEFYMHPLGPQWNVWANMLYWLWFVNVNVAVFNALPIYPLDGGRMFNITLKSLMKGDEREKLISRITQAVTAALVFGLLATVLLPFITG